MEAELEARIKAALVNGRLPCPMAFKIAADFGVAPKVVGDACNRMSIKIANCQLGCFP